MHQVQTTGFQPLTTTLRGHGHGHDRALQRTLRDSVADALNVDGKGRGIHGLALAIRDKLAKSEAGKDAVPSVLETINRALDDAAAKLAAQGVARDEIDAGVARFRSKLSRELGELSGGEKPDQASPATEKSAIAAREVVRERFSLDVLTAEGDRVSIRFKSLSVTEVAAAKVSNENGSATAVQASVISRGRFKVEVDGDLNDAERAAIGNLLDKVDAIAADFFGGDVQAAFTAAARVGLDSSALSAFDLRLSYSRSMAAVQTYASNARLADPKPAEPAKPPAETAAPAQPVVTQPVLTQPAVKQPVIDPPAAAQPEVASPEVKDPATTPATEGTATSAAAAQNTAKAVSAIEMITSFAKDVLERLDKDDESDAVKFSLRWKVEFMVKAFGSVALTEAEQKAADALGIALDGPKPGA